MWICGLTGRGPVHCGLDRCVHACKCGLVTRRTLHVLRALELWDMLDVRYALAGSQEMFQIFHIRQMCLKRRQPCGLRKSGVWTLTWSGRKGCNRAKRSRSEHGAFLPILVHASTSPSACAYRLLPRCMLRTESTVCACAWVPINLLVSRPPYLLLQPSSPLVIPSALPDAAPRPPPKQPRQTPNQLGTLCWSR